MKRLLFLLFLFNSIITVFSQNYIIETPLTGLPNPTDFALIPGTSKVLITFKASGVRMYDMNNNTQISTFWTFTDSLNSGSERGVLGICIDPAFNTNHYVYVYYVHSNPPNSSTNQRIRIVRFTENGNVGINPYLIVDHLLAYAPAGTHFGGIIRIRQSEPSKLYYFTGELATTNNAQLLNNPYGKILRVNTDGTIPIDNPFYDDGDPLTGNDDRIWSYGHRNSFGFCFSPVNDSLYESENGANTWDEVNFITKGKNYGWPLCQGYCSPNNPLYKQPMVTWGSPIPALTGIMIYNGTQMPWLNGKMLVADNNYGAIHKCDLNVTLDSVLSRSQILDIEVLTTLTQGPDDYIYALNGGFAPNGKLYRIKPNPLGIEINSNPLSYRLFQNYPNPFNPVTSIKYEIPKTGFVTLKIFNALGMELTTLVNETKQQGSYEVTWDASKFPSGVYFYELTSGEFSERKKMVLIK